jgi:hypothetical protein
MKMVAFRNESGYPPLDKLPNTNWGHYVLQQNVYTWLLERNYGIQVASMCLVQVHPDLEEFIEWPLPRIGAEVEKIMAARAARVLSGELKAVVYVAQASAKRPRCEEDEHASKAMQERKQKLVAYYQMLISELS